MSVSVHKPVKLIAGNIACQPTIGNNATIYCEDGNLLITSPIKDLRNQTDCGIEIETKNTIYRLIFVSMDKFMPL